MHFSERKQLVSGQTLKLIGFAHAKWSKFAIYYIVSTWNNGRDDCNNDNLYFDYCQEVQKEFFLMIMRNSAARPGFMKIIAE